MALWALVIILIVLAIGGLPLWQPGWHSYGYTPSGILGIVVVVLLVLLLMGRL